MGTKQATKTDFLPPKAIESPPIDLPSDFDWRTDPRAKACPSLKEIRDQANCGSCWAFGSVEAMSDRICISSKGAKNIHLSAQDMTSCATMVCRSQPLWTLARAIPNVCLAVAAAIRQHHTQRDHFFTAVEAEHADRP